MRIGRAHGRLVIIDDDGVTDVATASGGEFSADPDQVFAVWGRFTEWAGRVLQDGRTRDMIFSVPELVARISAVLPMAPGDLIFTGTPSGVGMGRKPQEFLRPGTPLVSTIEGIGELRNALVAGPDFL